jgi:hypothetical protein
MSRLRHESGTHSSQPEESSGNPAEDDHGRRERHGSDIGAACARAVTTRPYPGKSHCIVEKEQGGGAEDDGENAADRANDWALQQEGSVRWSRTDPSLAGDGLRAACNETRTPCNQCFFREAPVGIEPTNSRFAVCRLTTWPRRRAPKIILRTVSAYHLTNATGTT